MRKSWKLMLLLTALSLMLWGCSSDDDDNDIVPGGKVVEQGFVGSETCKSCHADEYEDFVVSGHNFKLNKVENAQVPVYPFSDIDGALEMVGDEDGETDNSLGTPLGYDQVSYVIGGYGWKARWIDADGYIVTGSEVQYNLEDGAMAGYHDDEVDKAYNCGNCHTTGWKRFDEELNPNRQDDLPGMDGTFAATGIQCESCHGPGALHAAGPSGDSDVQGDSNIVRIADARTTADFLEEDMGALQAVACSECHTRDGEKDYPTYIAPFNADFPDSDIVEGGRIVAKGGLAKHHEQFDELQGIDPATGEALGKHLAAGVTCITCHNPHTTTKHQDDPSNTSSTDGVTARCDDCHGIGAENEIAIPETSGMAGLACIDCHMPLAAKSAVKHDAVGTGPATGDIKSHIFKIDLTKADQLTEDGGFMNPWLTKDFACLTCHNGVDQFDLSDVDLSQYSFHGDLAADAYQNEYVGSDACGLCHNEGDDPIYEDFIVSGHPYKLNKVENGQAPIYPFDGDHLSDKLPNPEDGVFNNEGGEPASYDDISYVIGGYGWKARWIDTFGYIVTSDRNQYNLEDGSWSNYHADDVNKVYNCGNCHTTGWKRTTDGVDGDDRNNAHQDDLPGMAGTFAESGIGCESCHGAGMRHALKADPAEITRMATARTTEDFQADNMAYGLPVACSECHTRDGEKDYPTYTTWAQDNYGILEGGRIAVSGGLVKHHEQYDEMLGLLPEDFAGEGVAGDALGAKLQNGMFANGCVTCHDPHKTTKRQDDAGEAGVSECTSCHSGKSFNAGVELHGFYDCQVCHMPKLAKSAIKTDGGNQGASGEIFGDIGSHIFRVDLSKDSETEQFTEGGSYAYPWITAKFACGSCHDAVTDGGLDLQDHLDNLPAEGIHPD